MTATQSMPTERALASGRVRATVGGDVEPNALTVVRGEVVAADMFALAEGNRYLIGSHSRNHLVINGHLEISRAAVAVVNRGGTLLVAVDNRHGAMLMRSGYDPLRLPSTSHRAGEVFQHPMVHRTIIEFESGTNTPVRLEFDLVHAVPPDPFAELPFDLGEQTTQLMTPLVEAVLGALDKDQLLLVTAASVDWIVPPLGGLPHGTISVQILGMLRAVVPAFFTGKSRTFGSDHLNHAFHSLVTTVDRVERQFNVHDDHRLAAQVERAVGCGGTIASALAHWADRTGLIDHLDYDVAAAMADVREGMITARLDNLTVQGRQSARRRGAR